MHQAARAAKDGRLSILTGDYRNAMLDQSSRIPKTFTDKGRIKVPPKGATEWDGMSSPDLWDAVCFAFLEDVSYIVSSEAGSGRLTDSAADTALKRTEEMFNDV